MPKDYLFLTFLFCISFVSGFEIINKLDCGKTKSCFSLPARCQSSVDCDYLLKYSVNGSDVTFELSSNRYEWISVGFNKINRMIPGKALVCERHGDKVELKRYELVDKTKPREITETTPTLLSFELMGGMTCSFTRKITPGGNHFDLSQPLYFLYAAGMMHGSTIQQHKKHDSSSKPVNVSAISDNSDDSQAAKYIDTSTCGQDKICLRNPESCTDNTNCDYLVAIKKTGSSLEFSLSGKSDGWVAVGFNDEARMGGTEAIICYQSNQQSVSWGTATLEYSSPNLRQTSNETSFIEGKYAGGIVYCKFKRPMNINSGLDLGVSRYYIIFGRGSGTTKIHKHKGQGSKGCSTEKVDFNSNKNYQFGDCKGGSAVPRAHGALMLFAWMFLAVVSMFIARYSRSLWGDTKIFGLDVWFQLHRFFMFLAVILVIVSIIMIFVYENGWSESAGDHAVFGIVVLVLAILQPSFAFFRPHQSAPRRVLFNWLHRFGALIIIVLALVTLFKGAKLLEHDGGKVVGKLIIVLIVIAIVTALVLEFLAFRVRKQKAQYAIEQKSDTLLVERTERFWEERIQRALLALLSTVTFILVVIMMAFVAGAGNDHHDDSDDEGDSDSDDDD